MQNNLLHYSILNYRKQVARGQLEEEVVKLQAGVREKDQDIKVRLPPLDQSDFSEVCVGLAFRRKSLIPGP